MESKMCDWSANTFFKFSTTQPFTKKTQQQTNRILGYLAADMEQMEKKKNPEEFWRYDLLILGRKHRVNVCVWRWTPPVFLAGNCFVALPWQMKKKRLRQYMCMPVQTCRQRSINYTWLLLLAAGCKAANPFCSTFVFFGDDFLYPQERNIRKTEDVIFSVKTVSIIY